MHQVDSSTKGRIWKYLSERERYDIGLRINNYPRKLFNYETANQQYQKISLFGAIPLAIYL